MTWIDEKNRLRGLIDEARRRGVYEPTRMTLATLDDRGIPSSRMVLLKGIDDAGIVFYTNSNSRKGRQLFSQPRAAVFFNWRSDMERVSLVGPVEVIDKAESDAYWQTRPRVSRMGAWASKQSRHVPIRFWFYLRLVFYAARFAAGNIPRPPFWNGYRLKPDQIVFFPPLSP